MTVYGTQFRLVARGLVDYLAGIDPSAVGLVTALLTLIRRRGSWPPPHSSRRIRCGSSWLTTEL